MKKVGHLTHVYNKSPFFLPRSLLLWRLVTSQLYQNDHLWWDALPREQKSQHSEWKNLRPTQDLISHLIDVIFVLLIWPFWNTQVSFFNNGHFQPMPFTFLSNALSLTPLIHCSLSLSLPLSIYSPLCFHLLTFI